MTNTPKTVEELDEMRARAICRKHHFDTYMQVPSDNWVDKNWERWAYHAVAIREADERAGLVTVPRRDMTDAMREAKREKQRHGESELVIYRAMLAASPFVKRES